MNYSDIYTVCYNRLDVFKTKDEAKEFFIKCYYASEGAEHERYGSILVDLNFSNIGRDNVSTDCSEIALKTGEGKFVNIELEERLSIDDTIKYYEDKIKPILDVSKKYNIDFSSKIPFEYFSSDSDSYEIANFSDYYKEILENSNVNINSINTSDWSDGKYKLTINNEEFDITAWDSLEEVISNVDLMTDTLQKDAGIEM